MLASRTSSAERELEQPALGAMSTVDGLIAEQGPELTSAQQQQQQQQQS